MYHMQCNFCELKLKLKCQELKYHWWYSVICLDCQSMAAWFVDTVWLASSLRWSWCCRLSDHLWCYVLYYAFSCECHLLQLSCFQLYSSAVANLIIIRLIEWVIFRVGNNRFIWIQQNANQIEFLLEFDLSGHLQCMPVGNTTGVILGSAASWLLVSTIIQSFLLT